MDIKTFGPDQKIFTMNITAQGNTFELSSLDFSIADKCGDEEENSICLQYHNAYGCVDVRLDRKKTKDELISNISVNVRGDILLKDVRYPYAACNAVSTFDQLLISSAWGDNIERPAKTIRDVSTSTSIRFDQDYIRYAPNEIIYTYPSIMAMQYMVLYNPSESFYIASYSTSDETETFHAKATGKYGLELSICHYPFIENGQWTSPNCSIAYLKGGWHPAAKLYGKHMGTHFSAPDSPGWMKREYHGWAEFTMKHENQPKKSNFAGLPEIYRKLHAATGINHLFVVGWHDSGHDTRFPRYIVNEELGTAPELKNASEEIRKMGGKLSLYTNARLVDIHEEYYKNGGYKGVCLDENGNEYTENYGTSSTFAIACPGSKEYVGQMSRAAERIVSEYGADGMFVDQISCNLDPFCYCKEHNHSKPSNNFLPGVCSELKAIRKTHQGINRDFHTFAEGCHERFNQYYDVNQGHGEEYTWQIGKSMPEQFLYTFPDRTVTGHCGDKQQMYHAMAQFKPLDIKDSCYTDETNHGALRDYFALRKKYPQFFMEGIFKDDEGFRYENNIRLFHTQSENGDICVCLLVPGNSEAFNGTAWFRVPRGFCLSRIIHPSEYDVDRDGSWVNVSWTGAVIYILLEHNPGV